MGVTPRNAIKGYSYQQSIFILFLALMDTERKISKITVEATDTKHFDDVYLEEVLCEDSKRKSYRIQVKNYPGTTLSDVIVTDNYAYFGLRASPFRQSGAAFRFKRRKPLY